VLDIQLYNGPKSLDNLAQGLPWVTPENAFGPEGAAGWDMCAVLIGANSRRTVRPLQGLIGLRQEPRVNPGLSYLGPLGRKQVRQTDTFGISIYLVIHHYVKRNRIEKRLGDWRSPRNWARRRKEICRRRSLRFHR
jgi:hypothetical protein